MSHIANAVAPLKIRAMDAAEARAHELVARITVKLAEAGGESEKLAPRLNSFTMGRSEYKRAQSWRALCNRVTEMDQPKMDAQGYKPHPTYFVIMSTAKCEQLVKEFRDLAAASYEAFVQKMMGKIGKVTSASLDGDSTWTYSNLTVVTEAGETQVWRTQMIVNCSVLGTLFNQWPTRRVKPRRYSGFTYSGATTMNKPLSQLPYAGHSTPEPKHTPGPWVVQDNTGDGFGQLRVDSETHGAVAICGSDGNQDDGLKANARLIAAAPDMYELCVLIERLSSSPLQRDYIAPEVTAAARKVLARMES